MLYILPPPRTPNPPSPWESILCSSGGGNNNNNNINNVTNGTNDSSRPRTWDTLGNDRKPPPPRLRLRKSFKNDDGSIGPQDDNMDTNRNPKSLSECYFAGKGTALVLPATAAEAQKSSRRTDAQQGSIRKHLQAIVDLLRPEETLKMAVKLESAHPARIRYLVIISKVGARGGEESCLLGIDCNEKTTVGLVLKVMADADIRLDGDGGFSLSVCSRHHIFKPVSVQAMWSALQTLHKVSSKARDQNYFQGGLSHDWVNYYEERIKSDRSCLNEWHAMDNLESKRPPSPDSVRTKPTEREETEKVIRNALKEIMMSVDLDEVTSKYIRTRLEEHLDMDLGEYKSFIDQEMLTILGQMDAPTEIFDHVYLGSEWNASNYEELQRNGVGHILNVTREIDNFFPGTFDYLNVRVYDDEKTDLLKHWDDTFKYISKARKSGSKVLVHCKMGVSRSASVVIAYAMKAYNWDFATAMHHVKEKRTCIKPNTSFLSQLETYQGILDAMKNKDKLQRSKSETNLKLPNGSNCSSSSNNKSKVLAGSEPTPVVQALNKHTSCTLQTTLSGQDLRNLGTRPKSWSPMGDHLPAPASQIGGKSPVSYSLEDLSKEGLKHNSDKQTRHVLMPCDNGESYSVSPNQIVHLPGQVKDRINELESKKNNEIWDPGEGGTEHSNNQSNNGCDSSETVWTSSTIVKNVPENSINQVPADSSSVVVVVKSDPFSNQLDRVFDREEKKTVTPSRQSSWSSYDSAVVLGSQNTGLSRHSSWGSGDTSRVAPSRNSSWGSYDMRPRNSVHYTNEKGEKILHSNGELFESGSSGIFAYDKEDIPWHPGTVRRTKQKIEASKESRENEIKSSSSETLVEAVNSELATVPSAISPNIAILGGRAPGTQIRLSVSAPETSSMERLLSPSLSRSASVISTAQCSSVKEHRMFLENLAEKSTTIKNPENLTSSGIVKSLKKEFEAKTELESSASAETKKAASASPPASPVLSPKPADDSNIKDLVGLFENNKAESKEVVTKRTKVVRPFHARGAARFSCNDYSSTFISSNNYNRNLEQRAAPQILPMVRNTPPSVVTVAATVIATAATKKQQQYGKSHPLARLSFKKHNNSVYNTM